MLKAQVNLIYPATDKLAFRNHYPLRVASLQADLFHLHADIAQYFNLPQPSPSTWQLTQTHEKMLLDNQFPAAIDTPMDEFSAITLARYLALYEDDQPKLEMYLSQAQSSFDVLPDELGLWLGILHYKLGELDKAKALLTTPAGDSRIQNALVYTFVSHIAYSKISWINSDSAIWSR
ncbi:hypothetical protein JCM19231_5560 [Vibrio ishigakensis]|uniref:Uncharacterized protein n=1 Tax=Vibrio ishigakensis TaxID=1481914 RepID=A0A0B8NKG8_9VIBR|nr:hypothetical protein JCM19231_5560 [Vibrio ishigakensis]